MDVNQLHAEFNRLEISIDRMFNQFQAKFLEDAKLLFERAFGKSTDLPVNMSQRGEESDDSFLVLDSVESKLSPDSIESELSEISATVKSSDRLREPSLVQTEVSIELTETEQEPFVADPLEFQMFDEISVIADMELDNFDGPSNRLLKVLQLRRYDILNRNLLDLLLVQDIWLDSLIEKKAISPNETNLCGERLSRTSSNVVHMISNFVFISNSFDRGNCLNVSSNVVNGDDSFLSRIIVVENLYRFRLLLMENGVTVAKLLTLTLVVPKLDKRSFWADPSDFEDIFNERHFINSLRDEVHIIRRLPKRFSRKYGFEAFEMPPVSWSNEKYYLEQILSMFSKHKKLRCHVNFQGLKFTPQIETLKEKLVHILQEKRPFVALHLRYEMDILAFSSCTHGCTIEEAEELKRLRYAYAWWREKEIMSEEKRQEGLCPLTPEEATLILQALSFDEETQIYITSGEIYGSERRLVLRAAFSQIVKNETRLDPMKLQQFQNYSSQMAALDFIVSVVSNTCIPTYDGNMAKVVEAKKFYPSRQRLTLPVSSGSRERLVVLNYKKNLKDYCDTNENSLTLVFNYLGPQVSYRTLSFFEYLGPLILYLVFYYFPVYKFFGYEEKRVILPVQTYALYYWCFHYFKRIMETFFVHRFSHATSLLSNVFRNYAYYWPFGSYIAYYFNHPLYTPVCDLQMKIGFRLGVVCQLANFYCHIILKNLRSPNDSGGYQIPRGFLFNIVTCADYTTEIYQWLGFSIATPTVAGYMFLVVAILNGIKDEVQFFSKLLLCRGSSNHFGDLNGSIIVCLFIVLDMLKRAMKNIWSNHLKESKDGQGRSMITFYDNTWSNP